MKHSIGLCLQCGKPIIGRQATARFCCSDCSEKWHHRKAKERPRRSERLVVSKESTP